MSSNESSSTHEQLFELREKAMELKEQALEQKQREQSFQLKEQAFEQRQKEIERAFELKQHEAELDLRRREDSLAIQIEQHARNVKNDKIANEQERQQFKLDNERARLSLLDMKISNKQENRRLLELREQMESVIQQHLDQQITGPNSIDNFHIDDILMSNPSSDPEITTTTAPAITATSLRSDESILRGRQLKQVSQMVEQRYDAAVRKEHTNKQEQQDIQHSLQEIETKRTNFEQEKDLVREQIRSGQFDVLVNDNDDVACGLLKYAVSLPLDRLKIIQSLALDHVEANRIFSLSRNEWINDSIYVKYSPVVLKDEMAEKEKLIKIIKYCKKNSEFYGISEAQSRIEYRSPQLNKELHINYYHYSKLIDVLYSNQGEDCTETDHINPYDTSKKYFPAAIFTYYWESDYTSGKVPKLTPDLKLFFASPNIENGEWIQFHGPGTELYEIDPTFVVYLGSLCDPNKPGTFTSKHVDDDCHNYDYFDQTIGYIRTSPYQISIKWE